MITQFGSIGSESSSWILPYLYLIHLFIHSIPLYLVTPIFPGCAPTCQFACAVRETHISIGDWSDTAVTLSRKGTNLISASRNA